MPPRGTRPTTDLVREALFNALTARLDFDDLHVLDLYAGSGALGLEALSRGAARVLLVDSDARAVAVINRNIETVGLPGATARRATVAAVLARRPDQPMDLVLADPPYAVPAAEVEAMLTGLAANGWVAPGSIVVVERGAAAPALNWPAGWTPWPVRRYGDTRVEAAEVAGPSC